MRRSDRAENATDTVSAHAGDLSGPGVAGPVPVGGEDGERLTAHRWVLAITVAFLWTAAVLRSVLAFDGQQRLLVLVLLAVWLGLVLAEPLGERHWSPVFIISLVVQTVVVALLMVQSNSSDFFAVLLAVPTMRAMERWRPRAVAALIGVFAVLTGLCLVAAYGLASTLPLVAIYAAANVFFAAYVVAAARAREARARNESLAADLRAANRRLVESAEASERLGAARERQNLARDLHDSVTQTLFSMNLTAQSALLLLRSDPREVGTQLDQIDELARAALAEMGALGAGPAPVSPAAGDLRAALRAHCAEREQRGELVVTVEVDGDEALPEEDERALLRIAQEGLNNVVKHAGVGRAAVRLRLRRPLRLEVADEGRGFDPRDAAGAGLGLTGMRERASERGWDFAVISRPGAGTRVVVAEADAPDAGESGERGGS
jgi:signal transduction histidine kinase